MTPKFPFFTAQQLNLDWVMQMLKKILAFMPIDKGAVGDVLQRKANGAAWEPIAAVTLDIHGLNTAEEIADDDEIPIYDKTAMGNRKTTAPDLLNAMMANATPLMDGTGSAGTSKKPARYDHRHPTDTSRAPISYFQNNALKVENGGTGATTVAGAKTALGIQPPDIIINHNMDAQISAGTIGTRGAQVTLPLDYPAARLKSITIVAIGNSAEYFPVAFVYGEQLYCNYYRASTVASAATATVRCVYSGA
jgi:hypothetical protein